MLTSIAACAWAERIVEVGKRGAITCGSMRVPMPRSARPQRRPKHQQWLETEPARA
jgi:hypothetical protein